MTSDEAQHNDNDESYEDTGHGTEAWNGIRCREATGLAAMGSKAFDTREVMPNKMLILTWYSRFPLR